MNAAQAQIGEWLGVQAPTTETEILRIVEGRLAPAVIKRLISLGLERGEIDAVIIPQRTLQHRSVNPYPSKTSPFSGWCRIL